MTLYSFGMDRIENIVSQNCYIVSYVRIAADSCLSNHRLGTTVSSGSTIPPFRYHAKISRTLLSEFCGGRELIKEQKWLVLLLSGTVI
jgi:hypothetical protein